MSRIHGPIPKFWQQKGKRCGSYNIGNNVPLNWKNWNAYKEGWERYTPLLAKLFNLDPEWKD